MFSQDFRMQSRAGKVFQGGIPVIGAEHTIWTDRAANLHRNRRDSVGASNWCGGTLCASFAGEMRKIVNKSTRHGRGAACV